MTTPAAGMPHTPAPDAREYMVVVPSMVGTLEDWRTTYHTDGVRKPTREAAISHGLGAEGHDDWLIAIVSGDNLLGLAWQHEDRDDAEEVEEAARALGLTAAPGMPRPPAQTLTSGPGSVPGQSDRGTGVSRPENPAQADEGWYEFIHPTKATTHIAHVSESGRVYLPEADVTEEDFYLAAASNRFWRLVRESDASKPVHYREAAADLRKLGHTAAAERLESYVRDLDDEGGRADA